MSKTDVLCKLKTNGKFESIMATSTDIHTIIQDDQKYGFLKPKNGIITHSIFNKDVELTAVQVRRADNISLTGWGIDTPIKFRHVKPSENAMMELSFADKEQDSNLDDQTIAYHGYPLTGSDLHGICVVNTAFFYTAHGNTVSLHDIDPIHYPDPITAPKQGKSWDIDKILRHERGHGVFGLPHSKTEFNTMSGGYHIMSEQNTTEDILRAQAKAGKRNWLSRRYELLKQSYKILSER